ncbi:MAG: alanine--glyoxylate aminotransferase family protein, partial [Hyphomicrobiaceae bacterium]
ECARVVLEEGLANGFTRHTLTSRALRQGLQAMGLELFGDANHRMPSVTGVYIPKPCGNGEVVRAQMLTDFGIEIGTSFGHLAGTIWRIGTMGHVCRKANVLRCLSALDAVLRRNGFDAPSNAGVDAAYKVYDDG